jgi:AraC-like DNA-binding protein
MINAKGNIVEHTVLIEADGGYRLEEHRVSVDQIGLKWGTYTSAEERRLAFHPEKATVVSHFRLTDEPPTGHRASLLTQKQFVVYREPAIEYELPVSATTEGPRSFFELALSESFFDGLVTTDSTFLTHFQAYASEETPYYDFIATMSPAMHGIIQAIQQAPYKGFLKGLYLEAKAIELFLLQVGELDGLAARGGRAGLGNRRPADGTGRAADGELTAPRGGGAAMKLSPRDIERLHFIRDTLTAQFDKPWSITSLAREAGLNQMKLKAGFKALFGTTLFGYLLEIRMQEARRLLLQEKLYVGEVAERMGYQHPHHFTKAFRKKFGILPSELRK